MEDHPNEEENFVVENSDKDQPPVLLESADSHSDDHQSPPSQIDQVEDENSENRGQQNQANDQQPDDEWDETLNDTEPLNPAVEETLLDGDEAIKFAPGEGQRPLPVILDKDCEELSFPTFFAGQRRATPDKVSYADIAKS